MFHLREAVTVPGPKQQVQLGMPNLTYPDLCFTTDFSTSIYIPINSIVLREALLSDPAFLEKYLGLKIFDLATYEKMNAEKTKVKKQSLKKGEKEVEWK